jgi:hypothetical protein
LQIGYDRIKSLCLENPSFGFYLLRLTSARLFQNIAKFEVELEKRDREILRVRASAGKNVRRGVFKASRLVDSGAMDQRHNRANAKDPHHVLARLNEPSTPGRVERQHP